MFQMPKFKSETSDDLAVNSINLNDEIKDSSTLIPAIQSLLDGKFSSVAPEDGGAGQLLHELSRRLEISATDSLKRTVQLSMLASGSMVSISHMADDIDTVHDGAQTMASAVEEMSTSINQLAESSGEVSAEAGQVEVASREGSEQVNNAISSMGQIKEVVGGMSSRLDVLEQAAGQIGGMAQSIEDISNQTKLLALNATIEAARAGEAGKGFAVVASEVKSLSEQTSQATDEIRARIATLNSEMKEMASAMEISADKVNEGEQIIGAVGDRIYQVSNQIASVSGRMEEIASVLDQQRGVTSEIAERVGDMAISSKQSLKQAHDVIGTDGNSELVIDAQFASHDGSDISDYVLHRAKSVHLIWKKKLAIMLVGLNNLNADELADHHSCRLGKWYDQVTDPRLKDHPAFKALAGPHAQVHSHGREVARALSDGDRQTAFREYERMEQASVDVISLLDELTG